MPTFTVHAPPPKAGETASDPQRFLFVRDGFHVWAFLLGPIWLLFRRLWLVLLGYVIVSAALGGVFFLTAAPAWSRFLGGLLIALLLGFEASTLWRWTLVRRRWQSLGFVVADDEESAERRFFGDTHGPSAFDLAGSTPDYKHRKIGVDVLVAVADSSPVDQRHVIEQGAVAIGCRFEFS